MKQTFYRYYLDLTAPGFTHALKYFLGPESYRQMVAAGLDPETATDDQMAAYADMFLAYDSDRRVIEERVRGGQMSFGYTYELNPTMPGPEDVNIWNSKTVETLPDGSTKTVYANKAARVILRITRKTGSSEQNNIYFQYNDAGRVLLHVTSAAIDSIVEPTTMDPTLTVNLKPDSGLIRQSDYYDHTDPDTGAQETYRMSRLVKQGADGDAKILHQFGYSTHMVQDVSIHPLQYRAEFPDAEMPLEDAPTTSFSRAYY